MKLPSCGVRIIGLLVGTRLPQARPCGETAGTRAHRSLVLGAVAPGSLRADWSSGPEGAVGARRADAAAGFWGRLGPSRRLLPQDLAEPGRALATSKFEVPPFSSEDATKWRRQGAELQFRRGVEARAWGLRPRVECGRGSPVSSSHTWVVPWRLSGASLGVLGLGTRPGSHPACAGSDLSPPAPRC